MSYTQLKVGEVAPDFTLPISKDEDFTLSKCRGKQVVVYFYPKDDTPGCTIEAKNFRDQITKFEKANVMVMGISKDNLASHHKFSTKCELNFPLAADIDGKVCDLYGVWVEKSMYGKEYMGIERSTFLIDEHGVIKKIWPKVSVPGHVEEILANI